jgi:hypothetical protein
MSAKEFVELYLDHIFRFHGLSCEFLTDCDERFTISGVHFRKE